ncbi:TetR/AcrR family transcriptional regulator [Acaryochloris marina NIES-2412]|uniref:TetR/AcrR family transcriptional regulator n=1 Tax=Acaryochloris marina TaxID=155978 RepID=UPI004059F0B7
MPSQTFFNLPDRRRQNIINAAIDEFTNHSYESASISAIVNRAKIAKGSFYQYFQDKQDLYLYLVDQALEARNSFITTANLPSIQAGFFVYLRVLYQTVLEFQLANPAWSQILFRGPNHGDVPFREEVFKRTKTDTIVLIKKYVQEAIAQGQLKSDINPDLAAFMIVALSSELRSFIPFYLGIDVNQLVKDSPDLPLDAIGKILDDCIRTLEQGIGAINNDA